MYRRVKVINLKDDRPYSRGKVRLGAKESGIFTVGYRDYVGLITSKSIKVVEDFDEEAEAEVAEVEEGAEEVKAEVQEEPEAEEEVGAEEEVEEIEVKEFPAYHGGGYYILSNGEKVQGKEAAKQAQAELEKDA